MKAIWLVLVGLAALLALSRTSDMAQKGDFDMVTSSASIEDVKSRHTERLLQYPWVVSIGIGLDEKGEKVIVVGVIEELMPEQQNALPQSLEGYPVQIYVVDMPRAL